MLGMNLSACITDLPLTGLTRGGLERVGPRPVVVTPPPVTRLERLIQIGESNELLLAELSLARHRARQAATFAGDPRSQTRLGSALVAHARRWEDEILGRLATNRSEALSLLAGHPVVG